jgi:hypothetical protein
MGSMSVSDAAPLPRLGEVFFDVRGESRSMRLSWYADTGVAVFSIWQGGTCTGTFRLPITDLPRMVEALQRGPHGRDDPMTGEQPASREPRLPAAPGQPGGPGPARSSRPEPLDGDIETGQATAAIYLPPVESDLAGYQAEPPLPDYPGGYPAELPAPDFPGGYPGEPLAPDLPHDPSHRYSGEPAGRSPGGYQAPPAHGYPGEAPVDYRDEPDVAGYPGEPGGYLDEEDLAPGYQRDYREGSLGAEAGGLGDDPLAAEQPGGYRRESAGGRYPAERAARAGRTGPARRGYRGSGAEGMASGDYRDVPPSGGYPDEQDYPPYQEEPAATEYGSPGRPYVPGTRDAGEPFAGDPPERRKPRSRRRAEPSPDSFPYGPPPTSDRSRQRGRYPGRH